MHKTLPFQNHARRRSKELLKKGFTLIEIVLALGIIAFALTAILGLLGLATQETRGADMDARLAALLRRVSATYQSQPFSTLISGTNTAVNAATNWYDYDGTPVASSATPGAYFKCAVKDSGPILSGGNGRLLQLQISWPSPSMAETNSSVISVVNYR